LFGGCYRLEANGNFNWTVPDGLSSQPLDGRSCMYGCDRIMT
jgi:hypothetical protein